MTDSLAQPLPARRWRELIALTSKLSANSFTLSQLGDHAVTVSLWEPGQR